MEKCETHNRKVLPCRCNQYEGECTCFPECEVCVRVAKRIHEEQLKKCNWVVEVITCRAPNQPLKHIALKFKPRHRLKRGDYGILDPGTGYLVKAVDQYVRFYVVK